LKSSVKNNYNTLFGSIKSYVAKQTKEKKSSDYVCLNRPNCKNLV